MERINKMAHITATGYVHYILDRDLDFPAAMMNFARAFGTLSSMRDDSFDASIPEEFQVSDYHTMAREAAENAYKNLIEMSTEQRKEYGAKLRQDKISYHIHSRELEEKDVEKVRAMQKIVETWSPPTHEHKALKKFALEQLEQSIRNVDLDWDVRMGNIAIAKDAMDFFNEQLVSTKKSIAYHLDEYAKEKERVANQNQWLKDLRKSLGVS